MSADFLGRLREIFDADQWAAWFAELDRGFVFLLLLPFVVAVIGIWASYFHDQDGRK